MEKENLYLFSLSHAWYSKLVVFLLWVSHAIYFFIYGGLGVLGPLVKEEMTLSNTRFGLLFSALFIGSMMSQIPAGIWCDRFGVRKVMSWGLLIIGASTFFFSLWRSFLISCVILFFLGIGTGFSQVSAAKAIIDWFPFRGRATAMGIKQTGVNAGGMLASLLLPVLVVRYPWRFLMGWISLAALAFAFLFLFLYRDTFGSGNGSAHRPDSREFHLQDTFALLRNRDFLIVTLSGIFLMVVQFSFSSYIVLYLNQTLHYPIELAGIFLALSFGIGAIARVGWSLGSDYLFKNRKSTLIVIGVLGASVTFLLSLTTPSSPSWIIYLLSISFGLSGMGWNAVWLTLVGELSLKEYAGLGIGLSFFIAGFGVILGPPFFGLLVDLFDSFLASWLFLTFCMIMASFLILLTMFKKKMIPRNGNIGSRWTNKLGD